MPDDQTIASPAEMKKFAAELLATLKPGTTLLLKGELGAGKTTFVQGLAAALGISDTVNSPTFTVAAHYPTTTHPTIKELVHLDLYRLEPDQADDDPAVRDTLEQATSPDRLTVIEWSDRLSSPPSSSIRLNFSHTSTPTQRVVKIFSK